VSFIHFDFTNSYVAGRPWSAESNTPRRQHLHSAALLQQAACLNLIGEQAFSELYTLLSLHKVVNEESMKNLSRLVFKIIPYDKSEVIQMLYKLLYIQSQLEFLSS
jgi:NIMA (never in mitosis gene a)-related kinase